ncbi:unnamed protein product [Polarella glacialis]|uniref:2'-5'-oligoadenylate synthetase 1 domain-containing protein n=1 Tax=Polarella glacialis TaxID=89957 RepID=A0A813JP01_POLGL|nr:unnamed protein product [Polarella glacialis]CAE8686017.1 unnamed protein product [Polarella glacialis]
MSGQGRARIQKHTWHVTGRMEFVRPYQGPLDSCRFDVLVGRSLPETGIVELLVGLSPRERSALGPSLVERHVALMKDQPSSVKNAARLVKWWKYQVFQVHDGTGRLSSFLIELLTLHAAQICDRDHPSVFELFEKILYLLTQWETLRIVWSWGSLLESGRLGIRDLSPLILDPENPTSNVARTVSCWSALAFVASETLALLTSPDSRTFTLQPEVCSRSWEDLNADKDLDHGFSDSRAPWKGFEDVITEDNCHMFGINEYIYDKYGGMMGFSNWFGDETASNDSD